MTAQISDFVQYRAESYSLAGVNGPELFQPVGHGIQQFPMCTACRRGFQAGYEVADERLYLHQLSVFGMEESPSLFGRAAVKPKRGCSAGSTRT